MLTPESLRRDFPSLDGRVYLNTAAEGIPPLSVIAALRQYAEDKLLGMDGRALHEAQWRGVREEAGLALGLTADEVGFCSCSSEAYNLAALALGLRAGDEVVVNDLDFPAGATPFLQASCPASAKVWRHREGVLHVDDLTPLLSSRTRLVTVSLVSFFNGFRLPLSPVAQAIRQHSDALLAVDVTQALGRIPLQEELKVADLIVSSTHKWILASHGGGIVGVPARHAERWTVPAGGWFNLSNAFNADRFERAVTKRGAASFGVGMPSYSAAYAARAGLAYVRDVGVPAIDDYARPLVRACLAGLRELPIKVITPSDDSMLAGIVAFTHPSAAKLHAYLHARNIHVMHHAGRIRIAIHGYNTRADIEAVLRGLREGLAAV